MASFSRTKPATAASGRPLERVSEGRRRSTCGMRAASFFRGEALHIWCFHSSGACLLQRDRVLAAPAVSPECECGLGSPGAGGGQYTAFVGGAGLGEMVCASASLVRHIHILCPLQNLQDDAPNTPSTSKGFPCIPLQFAVFRKFARKARTQIQKKKSLSGTCFALLHRFVVSFVSETPLPPPGFQVIAGISDSRCVAPCSEKLFPWKAFVFCRFLGQRYQRSHCKDQRRSCPICCNSDSDDVAVSRHIPAKEPAAPA